MNDTLDRALVAAAVRRANAWEFPTDAGIAHLSAARFGGGALAARTGGVERAQSDHAIDARGWAVDAGHSDTVRLLDLHAGASATLRATGTDTGRAAAAK